MDVTDGNGPPRESGAVLRCAESRQRGTAVATERPTRARAGKRVAKSGAAREAEAAPPVAPERRFVDIDPWAVLLEQLMEAPDETEQREPKPAKRT
jgi:hypothetical protein